MPDLLSLDEQIAIFSKCSDNKNPAYAGIGIASLEFAEIETLFIQSSLNIFWRCATSFGSSSCCRWGKKELTAALDMRLAWKENP